MKLESFKSLVEVQDTTKIPGRDNDTTSIKRENSFETNFSSLVKPSKKTKCSLEELKSKAEAVGIEWVDDLEDHLVQFYASNEKPMATFQDIVLQNYNFDNFARNPVLLAEHNRWSPPIGRHFSWGVKEVTEEDYSGKVLVMSALFPPEGVSEKADHYRRLVKAGFLTSSSITIQSRKAYYVEDEEERAKLGIKSYSIIYDENDLVENSVVAVPENPMAGVRSLSRSSGILPTDLNFIRESIRKTASADEWETFQIEILSASREVFPDITFDKVAPDEPVIDNQQILDATHDFRESISERMSAIEETLLSTFAKLQKIEKEFSVQAETITTPSADLPWDVLADLDSKLGEFND